MHIALGRIVAENTIHHDLLLALGDPSFGAPPGFCLGRRRRHHEDRPDTYTESEYALDQKEPASSFEAMISSKSKDAVGHKRRYDVCEAIGHPEESQTEGQLCAFEEVGLICISMRAILKDGQFIPSIE